MKLYWSAFACSLASRIAIYEAEIHSEFERVDLHSKRLEGGGDYLAIAPKGQVSSLMLDTGVLLSENAVVLQYLADLGTKSRLAPAPGSFERYRLQEWLNYIATELHKQVLWTLAAPHAPDVSKQFARELAIRKLTYLDLVLRDSEFVGNAFSVADAYLYWFLFLLPKTGGDIGGFEHVQNYFDRLSQRPAIAKAVAIESEALARA